MKDFLELLACLIGTIAVGTLIGYVMCNMIFGF